MISGKKNLIRSILEAKFREDTLQNQVIVILVRILFFFQARLCTVKKVKFSDKDFFRNCEQVLTIGNSEQDFTNKSYRHA